MNSKALKEITVSDPYLSLLSNNKTGKTLKLALIKEAPTDLLDVITQISRHILNKTLNFPDLDRYKSTFYLLALPSTSLKNKRKILSLQSPFFFHQILIIINKNVGKKDDSSST